MLTRLENKVIEQAKLFLPYCDGNYRHVSIITHRNRIVSAGTNSYTKTHPRAMEFNHRGSYIHSELAAIVNFPRKGNLRIEHCTLYNLRIRSSGELALSAPCASCRKLIIAFNIKDVFYTNNDGNFQDL